MQSIKSVSITLFAAIIALFAGVAFAQEIAPKRKLPVQTKSAPGGSTAGQPSPQQSGGESHNTRATKKATAGLLYTPASDFILSYGATGGYYVSPDLVVGASYLMGTKSLSIDENSGASTATAEADLSGMAFYAYGRYFFGNSFNMFSGLGYRQATIDYSMVSGGYKIDGKLNIQSVVVPLFLGNMWSWDSGFSLGLDWVGVFIPLSGSSKGTLSGNLTSGVLTDLNESMVNEGDRLSKSTSLTLFLTTLAWAF